MDRLRELLAEAHELVAIFAVGVVASASAAGWRRSNGWSARRRTPAFPWPFS
jgi:hypothetical protein